jgi:hypothetical protein
MNAGDGLVRWNLKPVGDHWEATLVFEAGAHPATVTTKGASPPDALHRATILADQITSSPIFKAVMPPGTGAAISAIKDIASSGPGKVAAKYAGEGAKRLISAVSHWF